MEQNLDLLTLRQCCPPTYLTGNQKPSDLFTQRLQFFPKRMEGIYFKESIFNEKVFPFLCQQFDFLNSTIEQGRLLMTQDLDDVKRALDQGKRSDFEFLIGNLLNFFLPSFIQEAATTPAFLQDIAIIICINIIQMYGKAQVVCNVAVNNYELLFQPLSFDINSKC